MKESQTTLGQHLRALRKAGGMTLSELSDLVDVSQPTLSSRETDRVGVSAEALEAMLDALKASDRDRLTAWGLLFRAQGHPAQHAHMLSIAKVSAGGAA